MRPRRAVGSAVEWLVGLIGLGGRCERGIWCSEETRQFGLRSAVPRPDRTRTAVNPERNLPVLRKIAIIRLKFRVHPGNPGYTETPLYT